MRQYIPIMILVGLALMGYISASTIMVMGVDFMYEKTFTPGTVKVIMELSEGNSPEGIALDHQGNLFVGNRKPQGNGRVPEVWKITPSGEKSILAELPLTTNPEAQSLLGLAADPKGNVYAALHTFEPDTRGIWKITSGGEATHLPGSEQNLFPNALVFDPSGNLYVTDSAMGMVWLMDREGNWNPWIQHEYLEAVPDSGFGIWLPGANGIAFYPPNNLYVANTGKGMIVNILILPDGSAGPVEIVSDHPSLLTVDGIAVDIHGDIHAVIAGALITQTKPLVKVDAESGLVTPSVILDEEIAKFDFPLSLSFGTGPRDRQSVFITNGDLPLADFGPGPGVIQVGVGVPGFPIK
jgi:sugar lactone lactonase YvrE